MTAWASDNDLLKVINVSCKAQSNNSWAAVLKTLTEIWHHRCFVEVPGHFCEAWQLYQHFSKALSVDTTVYDTGIFYSVYSMESNFKSMHGYYGWLAETDGELGILKLVINQEPSAF